MRHERFSESCPVKLVPHSHYTPIRKENEQMSRVIILIFITADILIENEQILLSFYLWPPTITSSEERFSRAPAEDARRGHLKNGKKVAQGHVLSRPTAAAVRAACINRQALTFKRAPNVKVSIFRCQAMEYGASRNHRE